MQHGKADLFELHDAGWTIAVTTSGLTRRNGQAHLGAGCASECGRRFPWFGERLGALLREHGMRTMHVGERLVAFPVEATPFEVPDLELIERSARELSALATAEGWNKVALPRPGCGHGGLVWGDVMPKLAPVLDDRFLVVTKDLAPTHAAPPHL